jgi:hypothetical protein
MPASDIGSKTYRQYRFVAFMISSIGFRGTYGCRALIASIMFMLAGLAPAVQGAKGACMPGKFSHEWIAAATL